MSGDPPRLALRVTLAIGAPTAAYYALRWAGASVYVALVVSAVVSAVPAVVTLVRERRLDGLSTWFTAMVLGSLLVSLVPGGTRFLLAKEALLTAVTGVWFLLSVLRGRPLAYLFSRPLLEGRFRWPSDWEALWEASPRWRRMWRVSSVLYGVGTLLDAVLRVVMAYTLPPDAVPALSTALFAITGLVLVVVTNVYYVLCRVHDPRSPLRDPPAVLTA
jgi:phosphoglycerol transferase MdoB-like AlkP superfamily enzyme